MNSNATDFQQYFESVKWHLVNRTNGDGRKVHVVQRFCYRLNIGGDIVTNKVICDFFDEVGSKDNGTNEYNDPEDLAW